jgi:hypothetical protein
MTLRRAKLRNAKTAGQLAQVSFRLTVKQRFFCDAQLELVGIAVSINLVQCETP